MPLTNQITQIKGLSVVIAPVGGGSVTFNCLNSFQPAGFQSAGKVKTTGSCNVTWNTYAPGDFADATAFTFSGKFNATIANNAKGLLNKRSQMTVTFPNGQTYSGWVVMDKFTPDTFSLEDTDSLGFSASVEHLNSNASSEEEGPTYSA